LAQEQRSFPPPPPWPLPVCFASGPVLMPRSKRPDAPRHLQHRAGVRNDATLYARSEPATIFTKTKMCRFHILGMCSRGAYCKFAHHKEELKPLPDLSCTKLCKALLYDGACNDPICQYAHTAEELRTVQAPRQDRRFVGRHHGEPASAPSRPYAPRGPRPPDSTAAMQQRRQAAALEQLLSGMNAPPPPQGQNPHLFQRAEWEEEQQWAGEEEEDDEDDTDEQEEEEEEVEQHTPMHGWGNALAAVRDFSSDPHLIVKNTFIHMNTTEPIEENSRRPTRSRTWAGAMLVPNGDPAWSSSLDVESTGLYHMDPVHVPLPTGSTSYCGEAASQQYSSHLPAALFADGDPKMMPCTSGNRVTWSEEVVRQSEMRPEMMSPGAPQQPPGHVDQSQECALPTLLTRRGVTHGMAHADAKEGLRAPNAVPTFPTRARKSASM